MTQKINNEMHAVTVKLSNGGVETLNVPLNSTVKKVKGLFGPNVGIRAKKQRLIHKGKDLDDAFLITDIDQDSSLYLVKKPRQNVNSRPRV